MSVRYLVLLSLVVIAFIVLGVVVAVWRSLRHKATRAGYESFGAYMRAVPRSDREKQDAVDLTLQGLVVCFLGLLFPPLLLIGLFPLFYGARKLVYVSMGLGLVDDADQPNA